MMKQSLLDRVFGRIARSRANRRHRLSCDADPSTVFLGTALLINHQVPEAIRIGEQCIVGGELLVFPDGGRIRVGNHCFIGGGTRIWSGVDISIGNRVLISHGVNVHDSISHSLSATERHRHFLDIAVALNPALGKVRKQSVVIEDDAWIGLNAIVLKGVRIGRGAVVAAGAIVTEDVAPFTVVGGPAAGPIGRSYE